MNSSVIAPMVHTMPTASPAIEHARGGWIYSMKPPNVPFARFMSERLTFRLADTHYRCLEAQYGQGCVYVALQVVRDGAKPEVRGVVVRVEHLPLKPDAPNVAWSAHDEAQLDLAFSFPDGRASRVAGTDATLGKVYAACPRTVLEKLSPTRNPHANSWRNSCWARVLRYERLNSNPEPGAVLRTPERIVVRDGVERDLFMITATDPLQGVAFGGGVNEFPLHEIEPLLMPVAELTSNIPPSGHRVETLIAHRAGQTRYLLREIDSRYVIGWTSEAARVSAAERRWNEVARMRTVTGITDNKMLHPGDGGTSSFVTVGVT